MKTQNQVLYGAIFIAMAILFQPQLQNQFFSDVHAEVAGMDAWDLKYDWDFKKAVRDIVEHCEIYGTEIDC